MESNQTPRSEKSCACVSSNPNHLNQPSTRSCPCDSISSNAVGQPSNMCYRVKESDAQTATCSDKTSCSCNIKTSKYDDFSVEPESVGVVMVCDDTVCVDKQTFDNLSAAASGAPSGRSQNSARDRLFNMVDLVTSGKDPSVNRADIAQQIIREMTQMLRQDENNSKPPKLSLEDCIEAVKRGDRSAKKQNIDRRQCLDQMEQYLQTCFPQKKAIEVTEIGGLEIDPNFDPHRRSSSSEPDMRESHLFRSCFTDVSARFMTPVGGSATPSTAGHSGRTKDGSDGKNSSADAANDVMSDGQADERPDAASGGSAEPAASSKSNDESEASPLR